MVDKVKEFISNPEEGAKSFVDKASWLVMVIIAAVYACVTVVFDIINKIIANIKYKIKLEEDADRYYDMDLDEYIDEYDIKPYIYDFFDFVESILYDLVSVVISIAVFAVIFWVGIKVIKKINITWKSAFALATIELLIFVPFMLVNNVLGLIPYFAPISWIMSMLSAVSAWGRVIITFLALKAICGDIKSTIYVGAPVYALNSLATSIILFAYTSGVDFVTNLIENVI